VINYDMIKEVQLQFDFLGRVGTDYKEDHCYYEDTKNGPNCNCQYFLSAHLWPSLVVWPIAILFIL